MKSRKIIPILLILLILTASVLGCSGQTTSTEKEKTSESTTETGKAPDTKAGDPVTIKFGSSLAFQTEPVPWYETEIMKKILEKANAKIDYYYYDKDKFNLILASGDLPDVVMGNYSDKINEIVEGGMALDIWPLLSEHAPNMLNEVYSTAHGLIRELVGGEKKALYFIPEHIGVELARGGIDVGRGFNVRWDWYKEIGCPEITDNESYVKVLAQIVEKHPQTEESKKVYATGVYDDFSQWYFHSCFVKPSLMNPWTFSGFLYMEGIDDGILHNGYTDIERSPFWENMRFFNKLYNMGLFDPDSFTQTADECNAKIAAGQYVATMGWASTALYNAKRAEDPNTLSGHIRVPSSGALCFANYNQLTGFFPSWYIFISSKSDKWEAALRLFNVVHDLDVQRMIYSGIEGVHWDKVNGVPTLRQEAIQAYTDSDKRARIGFENGPFIILMGSTIHQDGYLINLFDSDEMRAKSLNPLQKDLSDYYNVSYPSQASVAFVEKGLTVDMSNCFSELIASAMTDMPTDIRRILEKCNDILYRAVPNLVRAKTGSEFKAIQDQVLKDLAAANEETAWKWCSETFKNAKNRVSPYFYGQKK